MHARAGQRLHARPLYTWHTRTRARAHTHARTHTHAHTRQDAHHCWLLSEYMPGGSLASMLSAHKARGGWPLSERLDRAAEVGL